RLAKNDTVFELQGAYRFPVLKTNNAPQWAAIHIPIRPQGGQIFGFAGGHSVAVANVAPDKRRAGAQVGKWLTNARQQGRTCIKTNTVPTLQGAKNDRPFKALVNLAPYNWRWPALPSQPKINGAIDTHVGAILRREVSISAGL